MKREALERKFEKLGLRRGFDFILHLPLRYEDETVLGSADSAVPGEPLQLEARVQRAAIAFRPRRQLVVHAEGLVLRFYNFYGSQLKQFQRAAEQGLRVRAFGELRGGWFGAEMVHPRYRIVDEGEPLPETLTPVYPATAQLPQRELRARILQALDTEPLGDTLSDELRQRHHLAGFAESVTLLHRARPGDDLGAAWRRMKFDEVLAQQLSMRFRRRDRQSRRAPKLPGDGPLLKTFFERLPFKLTRSQSRAAGEVLQDLAQPQPMHRLLQGDVGSGKTVVAAIACLAAVDAGWQAVVMAPTEILSEQHYRKFSEWLLPLGLKVGWLRGGMRKKEKLEAAEAPIVIGTHAVIEKDVEFKRLGLAVIDEQHRFGVEQRLRLGRKRARVYPHQLMMSATPIPRTLEMTTYGDLDVSSITELPPGRQPVTTRLFAEAKRNEVLQRIRAACSEGQQAYWVCPVIEESKEGVQTAVDTYEKLRAELSGLQVGLLHGRLPSEEKAEVMQAFVAGKTQVLVCTTVIEVGVDVPNASLMVIESAERFGLAQLHQLRGRIGRDSRENARSSVCILLYGDELTETARARLRVIFESNDGFAIAEQDLKIRGPGEFLGEQQSGQRVLRYADVFDTELVRQAREAAAAMPEDAARAHVDRWYGSRKDLLTA